MTAVACGEVRLIRSTSTQSRQRTWLAQIALSRPSRVDCGRGLRCRRRVVRPLHGPLFGSPRSTTCGSRPDTQWPTGARRRVRARALTAELVTRLGPAEVTAVDPSEPFVAAARARHSDVDVRQTTAERLPFPDRSFDSALAQLVVHFMSDPIRGRVDQAAGAAREPRPPRRRRDPTARREYRAGRLTG